MVICLFFGTEEMLKNTTDLILLSVSSASVTEFLLVVSDKIYFSKKTKKRKKLYFLT